MGGVNSPDLAVGLERAVDVLSEWVAELDVEDPAGPSSVVLGAVDTVLRTGRATLASGTRDLDQQAWVLAESVDLRNPDWRACLKIDAAATLRGYEIAVLPPGAPGAIAVNAPGDRDHTPTTTPTSAELAELVRALRADAEQTRPLCVPGPDGDQARGERNAYRDAADRIERALQAARGEG